MKSFLKKNLNLYLPIGAWFTITLVTFAYREFKRPKYLSYVPSLEYASSNGFLSLSRSSRKWFLFSSDTWKIIFYKERILLHLFFLLKSHNDLQGYWGHGWNCLVSSLTISWRGHLQWLGHSQNSIELLWFLEKNILNSAKIATTCIWKGCDEESKIFPTVWIESIRTMIFEIPGKAVAWLILHLIVNSLASIVIMLTAWWIILMTGLLWTWT